MVMAIFTRIWKRNMVEAPMVIRVMKGSEKSLQVEVARQRNKK